MTAWRSALPATALMPLSNIGAFPHETNYLSVKLQADQREEYHDDTDGTHLWSFWREHLGVSADGGTVTDVLDGFLNHGDGVPSEVDGGPKCFGHPIGATDLRMAYEHHNQLPRRAGQRKLKKSTLGRTHNLGSVRYLGIAAISIPGLH
jgi:acetyl-CoA C-acetyltransferase